MALNKNALIRYRTIDKCLQNNARLWTLEDLIEACSQALYDMEGKDVQVSKRTVQLDIQLMRGDKLGYFAPIEVYDRKYYRYSDPDYSIANLPINTVDMEILSESVAMLSQFKGFSLFSELNGVIQKLEDRVYTEKENKRAIIHIDKNERLKGLEHFDKLYQAIQQKIVLKLTYQSFKAEHPRVFLFHGYLLKEFNNRWFLVGKIGRKREIKTLALDRMIKVDIDLKEDFREEYFDPDTYYADTYGVTVMNEEQLLDIVLLVDRQNAPYVLTKPFHHSQQLLRQHEDGTAEISLRLHHNFELERLIFGFANGVKVLAPAKLKERIQKKLERAVMQYDE